MQRLVVNLKFGEFGGDQKVLPTVFQGQIEGDKFKFIKMGLLEIRSPWNPIVLEGISDTSHFIINNIYYNNQKLNENQISQIMKCSGYPSAIVIDLDKNE